MAKQDKSVKNFPNLRFPGFEGEWETMRLGDVMDFKVTNSFSRENLNYETGNIKNIHYGDIHTKFQTLFDIEKEFVPYINGEISLIRISEDYYCQEGDIVFADASEDLNDVGKSIEIVNLNGEKLLSGLHTLLARPNKKYFHKGFSGYLFKSVNVRNQIKKEAQGSKVLSINVGRISNLKLSFPSIEEQQKISSLISLVEKRIYKSMKIIENLKLQKNSIVKRLFEDKIKFQNKDFQSWEKKKLADVSIEHLHKNPDNQYREVFSVSKHKGVINQIEHLGRSFSAKEITHYKLVSPGDLVYTKSPTSEFPFGIIKQNRTGRSGVVSPLYCVFTPQTFELGYLLHEYFISPINTFNYLNPLVQKGAKNTMNINNDVFLNGAKLVLPMHKIEQEKIYSILSLMQEKIKMENNLLSQYELQKKYLLSNLFV